MIITSEFSICHSNDYVCHALGGWNETEVCGLDKYYTTTVTLLYVEN
jgi:hypothetical protein